jgi:[ribosomal protein S18]-alanine N-acetyltransferase
MKLRLAEPPDRARVSALHQDRFQPGWDEQEIGAFIDSDLVLVWDVPKPDFIHGFIIIRHLFDEAEILSLAIDKTVQGQGNGATLLALSELFLRDLSVSKLFLEVAADNVAAIALYQKTGFFQMAIRKGYYARGAGQFVDALVMSKNV